MGSRDNVIELNGKRYDTRTGRILEARQTRSHHPVAPSSVAHNKQSGTVVDGVSPPKTAPMRAKSTAHVVHQKAERSKTLMRNAVSKPQSSAIAPSSTSSKPHVETFYDNHDSKRLKRAEQTPRSKLISKFSIGDISLKPKVAHMHVKDAPKAKQASGHVNAPISAVSAAINPFENAINAATSHQQPKVKKPAIHKRAAKKLRISPKAFNVAASSLAFVLLAGFIAYQNIPNLAVKIAATRAGVNAELPGYKPAGFALSGPINYRPGQLTVSYKSNSDERSFNLTQSSSAWNSEALYDNFIASKGRSYQTYQDKGKTIYVYDGSNATWVDGGVWYQIEGNSSLNSDQLLRLASSL